MIRMVGIRSRRRIAFVAFVALTSALGTQMGVQATGAGAAIAPGCPASRPTAISGQIYGYGGQYNNWTVHVLVGMDLAAKGVKVDINGARTTAGYSYVDNVNPTLAQPGLASGPDRTYGLNNSAAQLCVAANVDTAFFEVYPKDPDGKTNKTYFGEANDQNMKIVASTANVGTLRLPVAHAYGGNTGDLNGYITYKHHKLTDSTKLVVRVWPTSPGSACGVQGFSADADSKGPSASLDATYYLVRNLAGGQCGATNQRYQVVLHCKTICGATDKVAPTKYVNIGNGARPRLDYDFE